MFLSFHVICHMLYSIFCVCLSGRERAVSLKEKLAEDKMIRCVDDAKVNAFVPKLLETKVRCIK